MEDPRIVISLFTYGLSTRLWNEVLKSCPTEVDEAYHIVKYMERPSDDVLMIVPATMTTENSMVIREFSDDVPNTCFKCQGKGHRAS